MYLSEYIRRGLHHRVRPRARRGWKRCQFANSQSEVRSSAQVEMQPAVWPHWQASEVSWGWAQEGLRKRKRWHSEVEAAGARARSAATPAWNRRACAAQTCPASRARRERRVQSAIWKGCLIWNGRRKRKVAKLEIITLIKLMLNDLPTIYKKQIKAN